MSYIKFCFDISDGIECHTKNLISILKYSYIHNFIPIIPKFQLSKKYNYGNELYTNMSEFYDYKNIKINNNPFKVCVSLDEIPEDAIIKFKFINKENIHLIENIVFNIRCHMLDIHLPYTKDVISKANVVINKLSPVYTCVNIQRKNEKKYHNLKNKVSLNNVIKKLNEIFSVQNVYIILDEPKHNEYNSIGTFYNFFYYTDFSELVQVKGNRYMLYVIEKYIESKSYKKISTFKNENYYNDSLTNIKI